MESCYRKDAQNNDSYPPSPQGEFVLLSQQKKCDNGMTADNKMLRVNLENIEVNKKDWELFKALVIISEEKKRQFLSDMFNGLLKEFLYKNPELFSAYADHDDS